MNFKIVAPAVSSILRARVLTPILLDQIDILKKKQCIQLPINLSAYKTSEINFKSICV